MAKHQPAKSDTAQTASSAPSAAQSQARILAEALPYMQRYSRQTVVVKFGGHAMGDPDLAAAFAQDIVLLKQSGVNPDRSARRRSPDRRHAEAAATQE